MILVDGNGSLLINPELIAYASANFGYNLMDLNDQIRLNIIRAEVLRVRTGIKDLKRSTSNNANRREQPSQHRPGSMLYQMLLNRRNSDDDDRYSVEQNSTLVRMRALIEEHINCEYLE